MTTSDCRFGFRIVGQTCEPRRLVDAGAAFAAHCAADPRSEPDKECYLSAFWFDDSFRRHLEDNEGSTAGYTGSCWSPWLWFDIDGEELHYAHKDTGALAVFLTERYAVDPADLLLFFSGSKGFHVGLPTSLWSPEPSASFHRTARRFAEHIAELAAVTIDAGVYDRVRAFRAPNSRHTKTGLHKRQLSFDELMDLSLDAILGLAKEPAPFDLPTSTHHSDQAAADWTGAIDQVVRESEAKAARLATGNGSPTLNRATFDFIREGATAGDRHRLLFSSAANLAEFGCPPALAVALLEESALDSGLPPKEVCRQIECGLATVASPSPPSGTSAPTPAELPHQDAGESPQGGLDGSTVKEPPQPVTDDSGCSEGQTCQQLTGATDSTPTADLHAALARLWQSTPAPKADQNEAMSQGPPLDGQSSPAVLPPDPPPLIPLPPRAVATGKLNTPCRCGSGEFVDVRLSDGRTRRDCRQCGRFLGWGKWYDQGGPTA